jgi:transcription termination/antitermination protein NusG
MTGDIAEQNDEPIGQAPFEELSESTDEVEPGDAVDAGQNRPDEEKLNAFGFRDDEMVTDEDELDEEGGAASASPLEEFVEEPSIVSVDEGGMEWYILKVQVNRENSICDALKRRVKIAGMDAYFGDVLVPTEDVREYTKAGKQKIVKRKLYPGYIVVKMKVTEDSWFLVRETEGIGDFTGAAGKPVPLTPDEVSRIIAAARPEQAESGEETIKTAIPFKLEDRVRVKEGYFQNYEGEVSNVDERNGRITVLINIFGRPNPVELDHWHVEKI